MIPDLVDVKVTHVKVGDDVWLLVVDVLDDDGQDGGGGRGRLVSEIDSRNLKKKKKIQIEAATRTAFISICVFPGNRVKIDFFNQFSN